MHKAERGLFDLMRGRPLHVTSPDPARPGALIVAVEGLTQDHLEQLRSLGSGAPRLAVTAHRARAMRAELASVGSQSNGAGQGGLSLAVPDDADADSILRLTTATGSADAALRDARPASELELAGLSLARTGHLLPAIVSVIWQGAMHPLLQRSLSEGLILDVTIEEIRSFAAPEHREVVRVTEAPVPLREAENARFVLYREMGGFFEHVAILIGDPDGWPDPVPVRIHSACLTGDLFGSLRCDCGEQLRGGLQFLTDRSGGVLLYLSQEGRGIGLGNKLRAYSLQEKGLDTVDADCTLGFGADERTYGAAVEILGQLGINRIQLLTNNPEKVAALKRGGIHVLAREPLHGTLTRQNLPYVRAKAQRAGHWLDEMLSRKVREG